MCEVKTQVLLRSTMNKEDSNKKYKQDHVTSQFIKVIMLSNIKNK